MSTIIMSQCWPLQGMNASQKAVLISLADNANDDGVCWPSIRYIAERTCLSPRAVQGAIRWLVEKGALKINERQGRSTVYTVTPADFAPPQELHPAESAPTLAKNVKTPAESAPTPADAAPITINNHRTINEPSNTRTSRDAGNLVLPSWLPKELWDEWDQFRKESTGKKWTQSAKQRSLKTLIRLQGKGHDPEIVIDQSIERGWSGLFPVKEGTNPARGGAKPATNGFGTKENHGFDDFRR